MGISLVFILLVSEFSSFFLLLCLCLCLFFFFFFSRQRTLINRDYSRRSRRNAKRTRENLRQKARICCWRSHHLQCSFLETRWSSQPQLLLWRGRPFPFPLSPRDRQSSQPRFGVFSVPVELDGLSLFSLTSRLFRAQVFHYQ